MDRDRYGVVLTTVVLSKLEWARTSEGHEAISSPSGMMRSADTSGLDSALGSVAGNTG